MWTRIPALIAFCATTLLLAAEARAQYMCPETCQLPSCYCASAEPPGGLAPEDTPQFVLVTFDDCVRPATEAVIAPVLDGLTNPDGRPVPRTYFVSRTNCPNPTGAVTDAATVRALYDAGHEIGNHTENHDTSETHTLEQWIEAISSQQRYLYDEVGLPAGTITGFRAPFLRTNEAMYTALQAAGFRYESSLLEQPFYGASPVSTSPQTYVWPHTLDYGAGISCGFFTANECPTDPKPGLWTIPAWEFLDPDGIEADSAIYYGAFDIGTFYGGVFPITGDRL
ncbi:MAG: polysaccharide deacetylase family protein, partial [Bacteroidota bacterium]